MRRPQQILISAGVRRVRLQSALSSHRDTVHSIGGSLVAQLALVVSGVLVARVLGVSNRGWVALLVLLATVVSLLGSLGMPVAVTYWMARQPRIAPRLAHPLRRFAQAQIGLSLVVHATVLLLVLRSAPSDVRLAGAISLLAAPALSLWQYGLSVLQGLQVFTPWNLCRIVPAIGYAVAVAVIWILHVRTVALIVGSWTAMLWAGALVSCWVAAARLKRADRAEAEAGGVDQSEPAIPKLREMLRFGTAAMLGSASPLQTFNLDQAVVGLFLSPAALGIYVVAVAFTNLPYFIGQGVGAVAYPRIAAVTDPAELRRRIVIVAGTVLSCVGAVVAAIYLGLAWLVGHLFGHAFVGAVPVARILLVYAMLVAMRRVLGDCARGAKLPWLSTLDEVVALVCLVPAVALFVGTGVQGVALAMVVSAGIGFGVIVAGLFIALGRRSAPRAEVAMAPLPAD